MILSELYRFKLIKIGLDVNLPGLFFRVETAFGDDHITINVSSLCNSTLTYVYLSLKLIRILSRD